MEKLNVESWIEELLQLRKQNKNAPFEISMFPQFEEFVNISEDYKKQKLKLSTETLQEADEMFLRYCGYYSTYQRNLIFFSYIFFTSVTQSLGEKKRLQINFSHHVISTT